MCQGHEQPIADADPVPHNDSRAEEIFLKRVGTLFEIDENGRVWRIATMRSGTIVPCERRRAEYPRDGYLRLRLMINGVRIHISAHRVVYRHFHGEIPENAVINHKDYKGYNNHPSNLEAISQSANIHHGRRWGKNGTTVSSKSS